MWVGGCSLVLGRRVGRFVERSFFKQSYGHELKFSGKEQNLFCR